MKKSIFLLAAFALLAASCTKTELVSSGALSSQKGIGFSAYTAKPTKAAQTDVKTDNFDSFEVTAIGNGAVYFDDVTFEKNGEGVWASTPAYFWPAYALDFYAYNTPANGFVDKSIAVGSQTLTFTPSTVLAEQEDLVAAKAIGKKESDNNAKSAIALTFNHYLTQVVVNAKCSNTGYIVKVEGVKLANLAGEGTYTFSSNTMEATAAKVNSDASSDYTSTFTTKTLSSLPQEVMANETGKWYLVPQTVTAWKRNPNESSESGTNQMKNTSNGTYLALKVKITTAGGSAIYPYNSGSESAWMAVPVPSELAFAQGKKYNVTVDFFSSTGKGAGYVDPEDPGELDGNSGTDDSGKKIIGGAIKFDASVTGWDTVEVLISL